MRYVYFVFVIVFLNSCSSGVVRFNFTNTKKVKPENGVISYEKTTACGFHLFDFIPVDANDTLKMALAEIQLEIEGAYVSSVKIEQQWYPGISGTILCTELIVTIIR